MPRGRRRPSPATDLSGRNHLDMFSRVDRFQMGNPRWVDSTEGIPQLFAVGERRYGFDPFIVCQKSHRISIVIIWLL